MKNDLKVESKQPRIMLCADLHLDHKNICTYRTDFTSVEEHNKHIKEKFHEIVHPDDIVYFLGDICFSKKSIAEISTWVCKRKILILGNHDTEHTSIQDLMFAFDEIHSMKKIRGYLLTHAPIHPDELRGRKNIHGHMHAESVDDHRYACVSLEHTDYYPVPLSVVEQFFVNRETCS